MILLGLGLAAAPVENGSGQCSFDVTAIHPAPCPIWGVTPTVGTAVSEAGGVAGYHWNCNLDDRAFYWTPESGFVSIPMPANTYFSRAWGINSAGQVCGEVELIDGHLGFVYQAEKLTLIFPPAGTLVQPRAINERGQVVGLASDGTDSYKAFIWEKGAMRLWSNGQLADLGMPRRSLFCCGRIVERAGRCWRDRLFSAPKWSGIHEAGARVDTWTDHRTAQPSRIRSGAG